MPFFSKTSAERLSTCDKELQRLFYEVVKTFDCSITCGHRGEAEQEEAFRNGTSRAHFGQSAHNFDPSKAVDVIPYPVDWTDYDKFNELAKHVFKTAEKLGISIKWGGNWETAYSKVDPKTAKHFVDMPHWELT